MNVSVSRGDPSTGLLSRATVSAAIRDSLAKLHPRVQFRNSVTLGVYVGSIFTTIMGLAMAFGATDGAWHSFLPPSLVTPMVTGEDQEGVR